MNLGLLKTVPNVQNVAANSTFTVGLPVGVKTYRHLNLEMSGGSFLKANVTNLDVLAAGKPIQQYASVADLEIINGYYGYDINSNEIHFPFSRPYLTLAEEAERFALGVADLSVCQVRGQVGTATTPALAASVRETIVRKAGDTAQQVTDRNRLGLISKIKNFSYTLTGAATTEIDNIPREAWAMAIHLIPSANVITNVEVWLDGQMVWDATQARMANEVNRAGRTAQTNCHHIDFLLENELGSQLVLQGAQDFRLRITHSGGATLKAYVEYLSSYNGI